MENFENYPQYETQRRRRGCGGLMVALVVCAILVVAIILSVISSWMGKTRENVILPATQLEQFAKVDGEALSTVEISERMIPSIVGILTTRNVNSFFGVMTQEGSGSGVIIREDGYIVTNEHVVSGSTQVKVVLSDGSEYQGTVVGTDPSNDVAVVKINKTDLPAAQLGISAQIRVGEPVLAIGNPLGQNFASSVTGGLISGLNRTITVENRQYTLVQTDAAINEGNSGGALVNCYGQLIGINSVKVSDADNIGFAIPIDVVKPIVEQIIATGRSTAQMYIGIESRDISAQMARINRIPEGIAIVSVMRGSPAEAAGLQSGDIIVEANGKSVKALAELNAVKDKMQAGAELALKVRRFDRENWNTIDITVILGEASR